MTAPTLTGQSPTGAQPPCGDDECWIRGRWCEPCRQADGDTAEAAHTLADVKTAVMGLLLDLAVSLRDDASECTPCTASLAGCEYHGPRAAEADRYEGLAEKVRQAGTADEVEAAVNAATNGGAE